MYRTYLPVAKEQSFGDLMPELAMAPCLVTQELPKLSRTVDNGRPKLKTKVIVQTHSSEPVSAYFVNTNSKQYKSHDCCGQGSLRMVKCQRFTTDDRWKQSHRSCEIEVRRHEHHALLHSPNPQSIGMLARHSTFCVSRFLFRIVLYGKYRNIQLQKVRACPVQRNQRLYNGQKVCPVDNPIPKGNYWRYTAKIIDQTQRS